MSANVLVFQPLIKNPTGTVTLEKFSAKDYMIIKTEGPAPGSELQVHFSVRDANLATVPVKKAEISIQSTSSSFFKVAETDPDGRLRLALPEGNYHVFIQKDDYKQLKFQLSVAKNANINIDKALEPTQVTYDSFFLLGVMSEGIAF